jgi:hypothetical protein
MDEFLENFINNESSETESYNVPLTSEERKAFYNKCDCLGLYHKRIDMNKRKCIIVSKVKKSDPELHCLKQFIHDFNLPVMPLDKEYIVYSLNKLQPYFGYLDTYNNIFKPLILSLGNGNINIGLNNHCKHLADLREFFYKKLPKNPAYEKFVKTPITSSNKHKNKLKLYTLENATSLSECSKYYVSIDFISANYNVCQHFDPNIFFLSNSWPEILCTILEEISVTNEYYFEYFKKNKFFRQCLIGKLKIAKIMEYSQSCIHKIYDVLLDKCIISPDDKIAVSKDEIVIKCDPNEGKEDLINSILSKELPDMHKFCRITGFYLHHFNGFQFYSKSIKYDCGPCDKISLKCIDAKYMNQCISYYEGKDVSKNDLRFEYEGVGAQFDKSIFDV